MAFRSPGSRRRGGGRGRAAPPTPRSRAPRRCQSTREPISSPAQLEKAEDFRRGQLLLFGARLLIKLGVLVVLVRKAPPRLREIGERRPVAAAAATAAGISVALGVASLPVARSPASGPRTSAS